MKKFILIISAMLLTMNVALANAKIDNSLHVLFLQTAKSGKITVTPTKNTLTLYNVEPFISFFSDRPNRVTGMVPMQKFLGFWNNNDANSFDKNPPNTAIETVTVKAFIDKHREHYMGTLTHPRYNAKDKTLTYDFTPITNEPKLKNSNLGYTVLFIDNFTMHWNPGGF